MEATVQISATMDDTNSCFNKYVMAKFRKINKFASEVTGLIFFMCEGVKSILLFQKLTIFTVFIVSMHTVKFQI